MAEEMKNPIDVVMAFSKAMEKMDFDEGLKYVSDDIEYINSPGTAVRGPSGVKAVLEPFFTPIEENEFVILRKGTQGDLVFLERLDRHRVQQGWFELPVAGIYEVQDGKIVYWREYFDFATVADAMQKLMGNQE